MAAPQLGRRPSTTKTQISELAIALFTERGFDETSVDEIAQAAGIARRTLFRYYPSKNAIPWGDFDDHLSAMRDHLAGLPPDASVAGALRSALIAFNEVSDDQIAAHRRRMTLLLTVPALQAHSMLMYTGWREVIAGYVASRTGGRAGDHLPQTVGWLMLGVALSSYEQWLADPAANLTALLADGSRILGSGLDKL